MRPQRLAEVVGKIIETRRPAMLWGPPGVGKSATIRQAAQAAGRPLVDVRAVLLDPVDLRGLPTVQNGRAHWAPPAFLPADPGSRAVLFLDELPQAAPLVQSACLSLLIDRRIGEYELPAGVAIIAAGNRTEDKAGAHRVITPILNRCVHLDMEVSADDWQAWAASAGVHPLVRAFINFRPALLSQPVPTDGSRAWPTPRAWECVSDTLSATGPAHDVLSGIIGSAHAAEFVSFVELAQQLPAPAVLMADPANAPVPSGQPSILYALAGALVEHVRANAKDAGALATYAARLPAEFAVLVMRDACSVCPAIVQTPAGSAWIRANRDSLLAARAA